VKHRSRIDTLPLNEKAEGVNWLGKTFGGYIKTAGDPKGRVNEDSSDGSVNKKVKRKPVKVVFLGNLLKVNATPREG